MRFFGQAHQDEFVTQVLQNKTNGYFLEIGSNHPIHINNSYILEKEYKWRGIMIEYKDNWVAEYTKHRPKSTVVIQDATSIDYKTLFDTQNVPSIIDYLQIDLEPSNKSTLDVLNKLNREVMDTHQFRTITFEHDVYKTNSINDIFFETRTESRKIFENRGYVCVFQDVHNENPKYVYEDWWVHPDLVPDFDYVQQLQTHHQDKYQPNPITGKSIDWKKITYDID